MIFPPFPLSPFFIFCSLNFPCVQKLVRLVKGMVTLHMDWLSRLTGFSSAKWITAPMVFYSLGDDLCGCLEKACVIISVPVSSLPNIRLHGRFCFDKDFANDNFAARATRKIEAFSSAATCLKFWYFGK